MDSGKKEPSAVEAASTAQENFMQKGKRTAKSRVSTSSSISSRATAPVPPEKKSKRKISASSDEDDTAEDASQQNVASVYQARPNRGAFADATKLQHFIDEIVTNLNSVRPDVPPIVRDASDVKGLRFKLNKIPKKSTHFCQFSYKAPIRLAVVVNMYGVFVNTAEEFNERKKIFDMAHLEPKHRLSMLVSSSEYWRHEPSKKLMHSFLTNKLAHDLKSVASKDDFNDAVNKFQIDPVQAWANLKDKLLTSKKPNSKGIMSPGVWNVKVQNTQTMLSTIPIQLMEFVNDKTQCVCGKWKRLVMEQKYIHAFAVINVGGFKLTRSGISLDTDLEFMAYNNVPSELQTINEGVAAQPKNFINCSFLSNESVSTDEEDDSSSQKRPTYEFN